MGLCASQTRVFSKYPPSRTNHETWKGTHENIRKRKTLAVAGGSDKVIAYKRLRRDQFEEIAKEEYGIPFLLDKDNEYLPAKTLRPGAKKQSIFDDLARTSSNSDSQELSSYRLLKLSTTAQMYKDTYREHSLHSPQCMGDITFDVQMMSFMCYRTVIA